MTDEPIPQSDPRAGILALRSRIEIAIIQVIESGTYILGREVQGFEQEFSAFVGVSHGIAVASGTETDPGSVPGSTHTAVSPGITSSNRGRRPASAAS